MYIHWFPGHMTKALREMESSAAKVDCLIYVLDARIPLSSVNPAYESLFGNKPRLYILNKSDLVSQTEIAQWKQYFSGTQSACLITSSTGKRDTKIILAELRKLVAPVLEKYKTKGVRKTVRAMVIGIPNCGKSTFVNSLLPNKRATTGNKPGVTRGQQWVSVDNYIELLDTPGTLYPDFSDQKKAINLAIVGSIKDTLVDNVELAMEILSFLMREHSDVFLNKFSISDAANLETEDLLKEIALKRKYILRGNEPDTERVAMAIIQDFRKGSYGKIILEHYENNG